MSVSLKRCRVCKLEQPLTNFDVDKRRGTYATWCKDCRRAYVREHSRKRRETNREELNAQALSYYYANREEVLEKKRQRHLETYVPKPKPVWKTCKRCRRIKPMSAFRTRRGGRLRSGFRLTLCEGCRKESERRYREANWNKYLEAGRRYNRRNRDKLTKRHRRYRAKNRERFRRYYRRYYPRYRARLTSQNRKYRAALKGAKGSFTHQGVLAKLELQGGRCYYCKEVLSQDMHRDHKIPVSRGGTNWLANIALTCAFCNVSKNNKTPQEYQEYKQNVQH